MNWNFDQLRLLCALNLGVGAVRGLHKLCSGSSRIASMP